MGQNMTFQRQIGEIYRLKVPFDGVHTSVFYIQTEQGGVLADTAATAQDAEEYIFPALQTLGVSLSEITHLVLTHSHGDHSGGAARILALLPSIKLVTDSNEKLPNGLTMYAMKGHTYDSVGVLDTRSATLISGDGLQGDGVGKFPRTLESKEEYLRTIQALQSDKKIKNILFSHAYEPWQKDGAFGREEVEKCLQDCIDCLNKGE